MNDLTVFIYLVFFIALAAATFAYMYVMMTATLKYINRPKQRGNVHPEMSDVQSGEELLVFKGQIDEDDDDVFVVRR